MEDDSRCPEWRIIHLTMRSLGAMTWALGTSVRVTYPMPDLEGGVETTYVGGEFDLNLDQCRVRLVWAAIPESAPSSDRGPMNQVMKMLGGPHAKAWQVFEKLVAALHGAAGGGDNQVNWNETIHGRQFDVVLRFKKGLHTYLTVVECKHFASRVPVEKVDAFVTKSRDVLANKAVMVSLVGFQSGATAVAKRHGIKLLTLEESFAPTEPIAVQSRVPGINLYDARLFRADGNASVAIEDTTGRGEYLWSNARIAHNGTDASMDDWAKHYRRELFTEIPSEDRLHIVVFPGGALWTAPHEEAIPILGFGFRTKPTVFAVPPEGYRALDRRLLERKGLVISVKDEDGQVIESSRLSEIAFDFETKLEGGRFYWSVSVGFNYYLQSVDGDHLHWVLIESYQHGRFIQAAFVQRREHSKGYLEIDDAPTLKRLRSMLAEFVGKHPTEPADG